jgi:hypothetical protein
MGFEPVHSAIVYRIPSLRAEGAKGLHTGDDSVIFSREMANFFQAVSVWWATHPGWVNFFYFLAAVIVSLFADRARWLLTLPIAYPVRGMLFFMERDNKRQLEIMRLVGDSAFKLVLYIAFYCLSSIIWIFWASFAMWFALNFLVFRHDPHPAPISPLVVGLSLSQAVRLKYLLEGLFNPEQTIKRLEEALSKRGAK